MCFPIRLSRLNCQYFDFDSIERGEPRLPHFHCKLYVSHRGSVTALEGWARISSGLKWLCFLRQGFNPWQFLAFQKLQARAAPG